MAGFRKVNIKLIIGIFISLLCLVLAFRKVDFHEMGEAFREADYWYIFPAVVVVFFSHYLRALRWRYLLYPIKRVNVRSLFISLMIGYSVNTFTPAHLGELLRTFVLSKKSHIPMGPVFATVMVERFILDGFSLVALMLLALVVYPGTFPELIINSGYVLCAATVGTLLFLIFLKKTTVPARRFLRFILKPLPSRLVEKVESVVDGILAGIVPLRNWYDYITIGVLSAAIWFCYGLVFFLSLYAFDFTSLYRLGWVAALILLVITTIAVAVPSSPGYVGTYHYLCQLTLALFSVPAGSSLSFATVVHGINFIPVLVVGLLLAHLEGVAIFKMSKNAEAIEMKHE